MFTGIIEEVGAIKHRTGANMTIVAETVLADLTIGDSVAVNGACLTVASVYEDSFVVQVSPESFSKTTLGKLQPGHGVNLERAMQAGGRFGGHMVSGHVDGVGRVEGVTRQGEFTVWRFRAPAEVAKFLIPKGSVTIDGISLTVVDPEGDRFSVAIIPVTLSDTTLGVKRAGDEVNMEADMIGKHIYHYLNAGRGNGVSMDTLAKNGFL